ncbi:MAG: LPS-assembly protein LptD [Prevotella sp.]|nr:LPS-assembly protein LptD [Prevotella sp.]
MRKQAIITLLVFATLFAWAGTLIRESSPMLRMSLTNDEDSLTLSEEPDTAALSDTLLAEQKSADTTVLDSLRQAIERHNKVVDDSIRLDSIQRARSNGLESPVKYTAKDSMVYFADTKTAHLYGTSSIDYENMNLKSDKIYMSLDSSLVRATGSADSTAENGIRNKPVFSMGKDTYESDTMAYNFKSKRGLIRDVYTEQQEGYLKGEKAKRDSSGVIYLKHGRYTTCDDPHPDFYIALSRAKVRPGKDVVFGPAYLVVADVPLPLAIPYGFFPFSKKYSSGFIMPSYGDEQNRGFYLRDGGYYFAINDKMDLKLLGEIYTRGSWGVSVTSNYKKRYKYNGNFLFSYQNTKTGDKGMPDFQENTSFKLQWRHTQDQKANPFSTLTASVNFATTSYERNNLTSMYNPQAMTQSTRTSSVNWSTNFSSIGMSLSAEANVAQNMRDSMVSLTLPSLNINIANFYPFRRKKMAGEERWYEKISVRYTGQLKNSLDAKEDKVFKSDLVKDWRNAMSHQIPVQANFTVFDYLTITPSFHFTDRMYTNKIMRSWDEEEQVEVADTTYGFYNVYNWNVNLSLTTKLYGFWTPNKKIFGDKIQAIRHVMTPTVTLQYAPSFAASHYGFWDTYQYTDANGEVHLKEYSPFSHGLFGTAPNTRSESITMQLSNNIEMKVKSDKDSTGYKKLSVIDELGFSLSYNAATDWHRWSDLSMNLRLKWWKSFPINISSRFAMYAYEFNEAGRPVIGNHTEIGKGRMPRFQGFNMNIPLTLNPENLKKWFGGGDDEDEEEYDDGEGVDTNIETNIDDDMERGKHAAKKKSGNIAETDADGYMRFNMPWSLTFGYGISMRENTAGRFNKKRMRYPYKYSQTLNVSGNVRLSDGWNINFSSGYDFDAHEMSMTVASLSRDLHCFNMSASIVLHPYTSYNFTFRCNASTLTDALKYDKKSGMTNAIQWY